MADEVTRLLFGQRQSAVALVKQRVRDCFLACRRLDIRQLRISLRFGGFAGMRMKTHSGHNDSELSKKSAMRMPVALVG